MRAAARARLAAREKHQKKSANADIIAPKPQAMPICCRNVAAARAAVVRSDVCLPKYPKQMCTNPNEYWDAAINKCVPYMQGDSNLDGTPETPDNPKKSGWLKDVLNQWGPVILVGAGSWWQSKQQGTQPPNQYTPPPAEPEKKGTPVWVWVVVGVVVLGGTVLLLRKK
jgi:hypothetical protein